MRQRWYKLLAFTLLTSMLAASLVFAGNGKIGGAVTDTDGQPAVGANVVLEGTTLGAAADADGKYFILNVPPGTYRVRASAVGFATKVTTNVRVGEDQLVTLNITMESEAVGLAEVVVEAARPPVDVSQTSARTRMAGEEFQNLPIRDVEDLVATSASAYKGFIRGGKVFETKILVDGIDLTDQFAAWYNRVVGTGGVFRDYNGVSEYDAGTKSGLVSLSTSSVEEASVVTGGMGADYRSATAGVVSYNLREGRGDLSGRVYVRMSQMGGLSHLGTDLYGDQDQYFAQKALLAASADPSAQEKSTRFTFYPGKYPYKTRPEMQVDVGVGGSVTENLKLYLTGGYFQSSYRLPNNSTKRFNGSLKLTYDFTSDMKLAFTGLMEDRGQLFGFKNTTYNESYRWYLEGSPQWYGLNLVGSLKWTHALSPKTFYTFQFDYLTDGIKRGYSDDDGDGFMTAAEALTTDGDFLEFADTAEVNRNMSKVSGSQWEKFFSYTPGNEPGAETGVVISGRSNWKVARPGVYYEDFTNVNYTFRGDITSQVHESHRLTAGAMARMHDFDMVRRAAYIGGYFPAYQYYVNEWWRRKPKEYAIYLQDRMEYAGLIINLGFRLDGLDLDAADLDNDFAPFVDGTDGIGPYRYQVRKSENTDIKWFFSPRLGVSHPISENAAMYFSFSRQQQSQPFSQLYTNYIDFGNPSLPQIMRADQDPIQSTNYDLGLQWSFAENWGLDVAAYYKDIDNYATQSLSIGPRAPWRQYIVRTNFGYADSRGLELTLRLNPTVVIPDILTIGGRLSYAYSYIKESVSAGANKGAFSTAAGDSATYSGTVPWEDMRYWGVIERNVLGGSSTLTGGYDRPNRINYTLFLRFPLAISLNVIGTHTDGFWYRLSLADPRSRALGQAPWNHKVDMRLEWAPTLADRYRIAFFVDLINALGRGNIIAYNSSDIGQLAWERDGDPQGGAELNRPIGQDNSLVYDVPREVYFGVNFTF